MTLTISALGHRGDGVADGPVYAALTLPGEAVRGTLQGDRLTDVKILTPSPDRVAAPCPHFRSCGGCALQHASDAFVARWKEGLVRDALAARGITAEIRPILTSPPRSRRRAVLTGRRTKQGALVGFHARASDTVVSVPHCILLDPRIMDAMPVLEQITRLGASRKAPLRLTVTASAAGLDLDVQDAKELAPGLQQDLAQIAAEGTLSRIAWNGDIALTLSTPVQDFDGIAVVPPPGAFLQATRHGEAALLDAVRSALGPAARIADLFAGCGTFSLPLARQARVTAVEGVGALTDALERAWRNAQGLKPVSVATRDLFRDPLGAEELSGFDAIVIDPPRAGAASQIARIAASDVPVVAHVSCNPATFARDARTLIDAGYRLDWVQPVDQFRWSPHVELAARFSRGHMAE